MKPTLSRVIVFYDGSALARSAALCGGTIAAQAGLPIEGVYVCEPPLPAGPIYETGFAGDPSGASVGFPQAAAEWARDDRERALALGEEFLARCNQLSGALRSRATWVIAEGLLVDEMAARAGADALLCVGRKGRFARAGVGSATRHLAVAARGPVLVAQAGEQDMPCLAGRPETVLSIVDGTAASRRAAQVAWTLASGLDRPLRVMAVAGRGMDEAAVERFARTALADVGASGAELAVLVVGTQAEEAELIEELARRNRHALLVIGAYADSWLVDLFLTSVTARVLSRVSNPVVLVHA